MATKLSEATGSYSVPPSSSKWLDSTLNALQDIVGTDAGNRGMQSLIVPGDFVDACKVLARLSLTQDNNNNTNNNSKTVIILSGFPCNINESPPTETDGPSGSVAIAKAAIEFGHNAIIVTDSCNEAVFSAALNSLQRPTSTQRGASLEVFPCTAPTPQDEQKLSRLISSCQLLIACERAGPASDGNCYTMRGINLTGLGLIAPLITSLVDKRQCMFIGIGDGGNEMGMGKVINAVRSNILNGEQIACGIAADYLIACSVSNWGAYALVAGAALVRAHDEILSVSTLTPRPQELTHVDEGMQSTEKVIVKWIQKCVPTDKEERAVLERCVAAGARDGVTGKLEQAVDGMPLERSLKCLQDIRAKVLSAATSSN